MSRILLICSFLLIGLTVLSGCATNKILLHSYEVEKDEIEKITAELTLQGFEVILSERPPPQMQLGTFIIYPRDSDDNAPLAKILNVIGEYGFHTQLIAKNRVKNHSYTNHIGLYLINPNIDWLELHNELDASYAFSITDVTFNSINCKTIYALEFGQNDQATIRHFILGSEKKPESTPEPKSATVVKLAVQWHQNEDVITLSHEQEEYRLILEREYLRHGNRKDLLLTLSPGNKEALGLKAPFACQFESRTPLVD